MLTREIVTEPRVRFSKIALFFLESIIMTKVIIKFLGIQNILNRYSNGEELSRLTLPIKRTKILLKIFINNNFIIKTSQKDLKKKDLLFKLDQIIRNKNSNNDYAARFLFERLRKNNILFLKEDYFFNFLRCHFTNDIKREKLARKIMSITFDINDNCNRTCNHCFANSSKKKGESVDYFFLKKALEEAREVLGCRFFNILGGEPFLEFDKIKLIAKDFRYIPFQVFTNGDLINEKIVNELKDTPNIIPLVSLEGNRQMTDKVRGEGTYDSVSRAFQFLNSSQLLFGGSVTATKENYLYLSSNEFANELIRFGVYYVWIFDLKPIGRTNNDSLCLSKEEKIIFNRRVSQINKTGPFIFINTEKDPEVIGGCPATKGTYFHIFADGSVMPCITIRYKVDQLNISKNSLITIIDSKIFKDYRNISSLKGCAQKEEPAKFKEWIENNSLVSLNHI